MWEVMTLESAFAVPPLSWFPVVPTMQDKHSAQCSPRQSSAKPEYEHAVAQGQLGASKPDNADCDHYHQASSVVTVCVRNTLNSAVMLWLSGQVATAPQSDQGSPALRPVQPATKHKSPSSLPKSCSGGWALRLRRQCRHPTRRTIADVP